MNINNTQNFMELALDEAGKAKGRGEVPVGAVVVSRAGKIIARAGNRVLELKDPTGHAEMLVLRAAAQSLGSERLIECDLYVTLEPCAMCAGAITLARIRRLYYGAADEKSGGVDHGARIFAQKTCHHKPEVYGGIAEQAAQDLLKSFFQQLRK